MVEGGGGREGEEGVGGGVGVVGGRAEEADFKGLFGRPGMVNRIVFGKLLKVTERFILSILPPRVGTLKKVATDVIPPSECWCRLWAVPPSSTSSRPPSFRVVVLCPYFFPHSPFGFIVHLKEQNRYIHKTNISWTKILKQRRRRKQYYPKKGGRGGGSTTKR